jgi:hypothetical protein
MNSRPLARRCHSRQYLRARKVVFIPDLIPQPDWDTNFFSGLSRILFLGLQHLIPLRDQSR